MVRFANDVRLVWRNGKRYNKEGSEVWIAADKLAKAFDVLLEKWVMGPWRAKRYIMAGPSCVCLSIPSACSQ